MNPHILFVDDEAPIRELLSLSFRKKGWTVTTAMNAAQARSLAAEGPFTLAILDVNMVGEDGLGLLGFFKEKYPKMPVLMFTGMYDASVDKTALAQGASAVMRKTESLNSLYLEVCRHLPNDGGAEVRVKLSVPA